MRIINLQDLPPSAYIRFGEKKGDDFVEDRKFLSSIIKDFKNEVSSVKSTSRKIGVPRTLVYKILEGKRKKIRLEYLIKIANFLQDNEKRKHSISRLQNKIYSVSCPHKGELRTFIKKKGKISMKFPFKLRGPEAAKALTFPFTDGYILKDYSGYVRLGYVNSDLRMHQEIIRCIQNTFGDVSYSQRRVRGAYETYFAGVLGKIYVKSLGFIPQSKLKTNTHLHEILLKSKDPTEIGASLSQIMDDEGNFSQMTFYVGFSGGEVPREEIDEVLNNFHSHHIQQEYMPNILKDVKAMLEKLHINSRVRSPVRYVDCTRGVTKLMWYLVIQGSAALLKINSTCKFENNDLRKKFARYVKHRKNIIKVLKDVEKKKGFLTTDSVKNALNISKRAAVNIIRVMKRDKMLDLLEKGRYCYLREAKKRQHQQDTFRLIKPNIEKAIF